MNSDPISQPPPQSPPAPTFDALPLSPEVRRAVDELGFTEPTPVQVAVYEPATSGVDLIVQARTGTGKTAAFGLPLVDRRIRLDAGQQALILAPTRELALQSAREIERLGKHKNIRVVAVYGGAPMERQVREIESGAQIISGTPGRVLDHLSRGTLRGEDIRILVLDEADEMLSMGFARELNAIVEHLSATRQTMLFSATLDDSVQRLSQRITRDPITITLSTDAVGALTISHFVYMVSGAKKTHDLIRILESEDPESAIIFCNTKAVTEQVAAELQHAGFQADWLNGDLPQGDREKVLLRTRKGELRYLVATDVAARGIDISHLTHVVNYDFPDHIEAYVHRTGRTGRAGRTGTAISLITPQDLGALYYVRLAYKIFPVERSLPSAGEMQTRKELDRVELLSEAFSAEPGPDDRAIARRLLVHDDAEQIVAGLLKAFFGSRGISDDVEEQAAAARRARAPRQVPIELDRNTATAEGEKEKAKAKASESEEPRRRRRRERSAPPRTESPPSAELETEVTLAQMVAVPAPSEGPPERFDETVPTGEIAAEGDPEMTTLFLNLGRRDSVRVGDILRLFETWAGLTKDELGRIRIRDRHTFIGVPKGRTDAVLAAFSGRSAHEKELVVEIARAEQRTNEATPSS